MAKRKQVEQATRKGVYLADETFMDAEAGYANGDLWIWSKDNTVSIVDIFPLVSDPGKTEKITFVVTDSVQQIWEGFTRLVTIDVDADNYIKVRLRKGETADV